MTKRLLIALVALLVPTVLVAAPVAAADPPLVSATAPSISGSGEVGRLLVASPGTWTPSADSYTYQWLIDGAPALGSAGEHYAPVEGDVGKTVQVRVTAAKDGYTAGTVTSAGLVVLAGQFRVKVAPAIIGGVRAGNTVFAHPGTWSPAAESYAFQWLADGQAVPGATNDAFAIPGRLAGKVLKLRVTMVHDGYAPKVALSPGVTVAKGVLTNSTRPRISGVLRAGHTLATTTGFWSPTGLTFHYRWLRDGAPIAGATGGTYHLRAADRGHRIRVRVFASRYGFTPNSAVSAATAAVP